jgi:hypothetical protein
MMQGSWHLVSRGYRTKEFGTHRSWAQAAHNRAEKAFVRLYYFTSAKYAVRNIENCRLKVARLSDTNDPFELMGLMIREQSVRQGRKGFQEKGVSQRRFGNG